MVGTPPVLDPMASVKIPTALQTRVAIAMDGGAMDDAPPRLATRHDATASARSAVSTTVIAAPTPPINRNSTSAETDPTATPTPTTDAPDRPARSSTSTTTSPSSRTASATSATTILPGPRALPPPPADYTLPASATAPVITTAAAPAKPTSDVDSGVDERYRDAHLTPEQVANVETHGTLLQIVGTTDKPAWWSAVTVAKWAPVAVAGVILAATVGGIVGWRRVRRRRRAAKGEMVQAREEEGGVVTASDAMLEPERSS
ncbi:hypothetical protein GGF32_000600 [Allomyces javanicus]|nr:hypothetical protein GGF32_000600 [Allomyces javanicus]